MKKIITFILGVFALIIAFRIVGFLLKTILGIILFIISVFITWLFLEILWEGIKKLVVGIAEIISLYNH